MKSPTTKDLEELTRVGRHLRRRPVGANVFGLQHCLKFRKQPVAQAMLETWERETPDPEWQSNTGEQCRAPQP